MMVSFDDPEFNHHELLHQQNKETTTNNNGHINERLNLPQRRFRTIRVNADEVVCATRRGVWHFESRLARLCLCRICAKSAFKQEHLKAAKNNPRLCAQIEQKFEEMARDANNRRATFPPMTKFLRGVVHEYAKARGIHLS